MTATIIPINATQPSVIWSSSNSSIATVDANGTVTAGRAGTATITATTYDGGFTATCMVTVFGPTSGTLDGHEWIDLGLPSGLRWATCNLGATTPEEYGEYYAWGETDSKWNFAQLTYKWNKSSNLITKYNISSTLGTVDDKTALDSEDDAAIVNWGGSWRMPTNAECTELIEKCNWTWTDQNGVMGRLVTGPNGKSIFLPAAGYRDGTDLYVNGSWGEYWTSSLWTDYSQMAMLMSAGWSGVDIGHDIRYRGLSIRPVTE